MAKNLIFACEDFLEMSVQELKYFLEMRLMSQVGTKLDLAATAEATSQQKIPIRQDLDK